MQTPHQTTIVLLTLLVLSSVTFALTAEQEARFFLKSGETFKTDSIAIKGATYYLLKINGDPAVVLSPTDDGYVALTDESKLDAVISAYQEQVFKQRAWNKSISTLDDARNVTQTTVADCVAGGKTFVRFIPTRLVRIGSVSLSIYYLISRSKDGIYKLEYDAIRGFNTSFPSFEKAVNAFVDKSGTLKEAVSGGNAALALEAAGGIRDSATTLKKEYTSVTSAYASLGQSKDFSAILQFTFYEQGNKHTCAFDGNVTSSMAKVEAEFSDKSLQPAEQLKTYILAQTKDREKSAASQTAYAIREEHLAKINTLVLTTLQLYSSAKPPVVLTSLNAQLAALQKSLSALKVGGNASTKDFDAVSKKTEDDTKTYSQFAPEYKAAAKAVLDADANVAAATKRYGDADTRVADLKTQYAGIQKSLSQNVLALQSANFQQLRFANVTATAKELSQSAANLKPKESEIDPVVIGAVVVLLLGLVGTVLYFRKIKASQRKEVTLEDK